jgi:predicted dehydrogenase
LYGVAEIGGRAGIVTSTNGGLYVPPLLRVGVAGAGVFGSYHAAKLADRDLVADSNIVFAGVYDTDAERAQALAQKFNTKTYQSYDAFLREMDAVVIAAPASDHFSLCEAALLKGCHCFVEKPLALTVSAVDRLVALADTKNLVLQIGHQERYVCAAVGLFSRERAPVRIECVRRVPHTGRCDDVSVAFDLMVHDLDIVRQLSGADLSTVYASGNADEISAELLLENGTVVVLEAARRSSVSERRMTLVYGDGVIDFDFIERTISNTTPAQLNGDISADKAPLAIRDPLAYGAALFVEAIRLSKTPIVSGHDGRVTVSWAQQIEQAAQIGVEPMGVEAVVDKRLRA